MSLKRSATAAVVSLCLTTWLAGCATSGKTVLTGTAAGAALAAGVGALADPGPKGRGRIRNVFIGATAGSLLGAGAGYLIGNAIENSAKEGFEKGKAEGEKSASSTQPKLLPPKVESQFIESQVRGNVYIPGHFEYRIVEPSRWSR